MRLPRRRRAGWVTATSPHFSLPRGRTPGSSASPGRWQPTTSVHSSRPRSRSIIAGRCLEATSYEVELPLEGPADFVGERDAVGRQPGDGRAPGRDAALSDDRRRHPVARGHRRAALPDRADALPTAFRRRARRGSARPARQLQRIRGLRRTTTATTWRRWSRTPVRASACRSIHGLAVRPLPRQADAARRRACRARSRRRHCAGSGCPATGLRPVRGRARLSRPSRPETRKSNATSPVALPAGVEAALDEARAVVARRSARRSTSASRTPG